MKYRFNWVTGMLTGGAIGAAVGILAAPRSGEKTRRMLRDKGMELRDGANQALEDARDRMDEAKGDVRRRFSDLKAVGQELYEEEKELLEKGVAKAAKAAKAAEAKVTKA